MSDAPTPKSNFFKDVQTEAGKITWPTRQQTFQITFLVLVATGIVAVYIGAVDYVLNLILENYVLG